MDLYKIIGKIQSREVPAKSLRFRSSVKDLDKEVDKYLTMGYMGMHLDNGVYAVNDGFTTIVMSDKKIELPEDSHLLFASTPFETIDLSEVDASKVKTIHAFCGYTSVPELHIKGFNAPNLEDTTAMFRNCEIGKLKIEFDTSKVKEMRGMFMHSNIGTLDLREMNFDGINNFISLRAMFGDAVIENLYLNNQIIPNTGMFVRSTIHNLVCDNKEVIEAYEESRDMW